VANVLYAEDDRDCRELFAFALRQQGHKVHEAINGAQAVQILREESIDLVILDARMPMTTGYDAARVIAKESPHTPVIFLSARGMHREINMAFECGPMVIDYLVKPLSPQQLVDQVEYLLKSCKIRGLAPVREENMARELVTAEW
jgi:DNA-binding response OmpR family regulator